MGDLITDVRVWPVNHDTLKANVSFTVSGAFAVRAVIRKTKNGLMVGMPSESYMKDGEKKYKDFVFPITKEARDEMNKTVIEAYNAEVGGGKPSSSDGPKKNDKVPF